jgi:hypothetical protein
MIVYQITMILMVISESVGTAALSGMSPSSQPSSAPLLIARRLR